MSTTQTGANKAGMESIDKDRQAQIIYEMSKGSMFFKRQVEQDEKVNQKVEIMKKKLLSLTVPQKQLFLRTTAERVIEIEKTRCFDRICCVLDMDMFFAAVEIRDQPHLRDLPVAVGGTSLRNIVLFKHC
jgi:DNA polymerase kappa